jgi:TetR/AcrR family transcriptional regulator, ethionamide resistance regulator
LILAAATELVRERTYAELSVGEIMEKAGRERTIFYRHFDGLGDLLLQASLEAVGKLYQAQTELAATRENADPASVRAAIESAARIYSENGPLLRAVTEAGLSDPQIREQGEALRTQLNTLVVDMLNAVPEVQANPPADIHETARALNLLSEVYLRDTFGREARIPVEKAVQTLTEIWLAVINGAGREGKR